MLDFLAIGDVMLDVHAPAAASGGVQHAPISAGAGGSAVNAARTAARVGARAAVLGAVGGDAVGRMIAQELESQGIEALFAVVPGVATGTAVYTGDTVIADRGANAAFEPDGIPDSRVTLVSAYLPPSAREQALAAASGLRAVDLQGVLADVPGAPVVLGPALDVAALAGRHDVVCSTLGRDGAEAVRGDERASARPPRILDGPLVGAGDAFAAGFLLALADGRPIAACLERGCAAVVDR